MKSYLLYVHSRCAYQSLNLNWELLSLLQETEFFLDCFGSCFITVNIFYTALLLLTRLFSFLVIKTDQVRQSKNTKKVCYKSYRGPPLSIIFGTWKNCTLQNSDQLSNTQNEFHQYDFINKEFHQYHSFKIRTIEIHTSVFVFPRGC